MNLSLSEEESDSDEEITTRRPSVAKRPRLESDTDSQRDGTLPPPHPCPSGVDTNAVSHVPGTADESTDLPTAITSGPPLHCSGRSKLETNNVPKSSKRHSPRESISPQATAAGDMKSNDSDTGSSKMVSIKLTDALLSSRKYSLRKVLGMVDRQQRETVAKQPQQPTSLNSNRGDGVTVTSSKPVDDKAGRLRQILGMVDTKQTLTISKQSLPLGSNGGMPLDDKVPPEGISPEAVSSDSNEETLSASEGGSGERCGMVKRKSHRYAGRDLCLLKAKAKNTGRLGNRRRKGAGFGRARINKRRRATYRMRGAVVSTETSDSESDSGRGGTAGGAPVRRSKRTTKGKSLRHLQDSSDTEYSPTPAKKQKTEPGARDPPPFCTKARRSPLHGNILADILMDVPEVDICSLSSQISKRSQEATEKKSSPSTSKDPSHRMDPSSGPQRPRSLQLPTDATSTQRLLHTNTHTREPSKPVTMATQTSTLPSGCRVELNIKQNMSLSGPNKRLTALLVKKSVSHHKVKSVDPLMTKGTEATTMDSGKPVRKKSQGTHSRVLMSWEKDITLGAMATRAPVLYALENIPEKIAEVEGPWMEKAKLIWTYWKKVLPSERDKYTERAKQNRLLEKGTATGKQIKSKEQNQSKDDTTQAPSSSTTTKEELRTQPLTSGIQKHNHSGTELRTQPLTSGIQKHNHSGTELRMQPLTSGIQKHNHSGTELRTQPLTSGIQKHNHSGTELRMQPLTSGIQKHNHSGTELRTQPLTSGIQKHNHSGTELRTQPLTSGIQQHNRSGTELRTQHLTSDIQQHNGNSTELRTQPLISDIQQHNRNGTGLATVQTTLNAQKVSPKQSSKPAGGTISHAPLITQVITPSWFYSVDAGPTNSRAQTPHNYKGIVQDGTAGPTSSRAQTGTTPPNYKGVTVRDGEVIVSPTSPFAQRISLHTNMVSCELKEGGTKTEDLCSAVDREIETLEETLAGSPTTPPCSPSLQHHSKPFNSPDKQSHDYPQLPSPPVSTTGSTGSPQSALKEGGSSPQTSKKSSPKSSKKVSISSPQTSKKGSAHSSIKGGSTSPKVQSPAEMAYGATSIGSNVLPTPSQITNFCTNLGPAIPLQGAPFYPVAGRSPFAFLVYSPSLPPSFTDGLSTATSSDLLVSAANHSSTNSLPITSHSVTTSRAPKGSTLHPQNAKKCKRSKAKSQQMKTGAEIKKEGVSPPTKSTQMDPKKPSTPEDTSNERTVPKKDEVKGVSINPLSPNTIRYRAPAQIPEQEGNRSYGHVDRLSILNAIRAKIYSQIPSEFATNVPAITSSSLPTANFESPPNVTFQPSQSSSSPAASVGPPISATADIFDGESNPLYELLNVPPVTTKRTRPISTPTTKLPKSKLQRREISQLTATTASTLRTTTVPGMSRDIKTEKGVALTAETTPVFSSFTNVMPMLPFASVDLSSFLSQNASSATLPFQRFLPYPQASQQPLMFAANGEMQHFLEGSVFATPTPLPIAPTLVNAKPQIQMPTCQIPHYPSDESPGFSSQSSSRAYLPYTSTGHQKQDPSISTQAQTQTGTSVSSPHTSSSQQHVAIPSPSILASTLHCKTEKSGASAQSQVATSFSELSASLRSSASATLGSRYQGTTPNAVCAPTTEKSLVHDATAPQQTCVLLQSPNAAFPSTSAKPQLYSTGLSLPPTSIPLTSTRSPSTTTHQSNSHSIVTASLSSANSKMDVLKKVQELNLGWTKPAIKSIAKVENAGGNPETTPNKDASAKKPRKRSNKVPSSSSVPLVARSPVEQLSIPPTPENTYTLTSPQPFVVSPAESYQEVFKQEIFSSQVTTTPVGGEASEDLVTIDQPVLQINPPFGDVSLNQREIERLYIQNMAVLEQQRRYTKMLEQKLIKMEEECNKQTKKPDKMDVYKSFLGFVVEPACEGDVPINIPGYSAQASEEVEFSDGRKPVLKSDFDIYASFVP